MIDRDIKGTSVKIWYFYGQRGTYIRRDPQTKVHSNCGLREGSTRRREYDTTEVQNSSWHFVAVSRHLGWI